MENFFGFGDFSGLVPSGEERWKMINELSLALVRNQGQEDNVDPHKRIDAESFFRVAQLNVSEILDLDVSSVKLVSATREDMTRDFLKSYRPFFESLSDSNSGGSSELTSITKIFSVFIMASSVGKLGLEAMSSYEILAARDGNPREIFLCPSGVQKFTDEWTLPEENFWMWFCLSELSKHAVISIPYIHNELSGLIQEFTASFEPVSAEAMERVSQELPLMDFGEGEEPNLGDLESEVMRLISNEPEILMGAQISEVQETISQQMAALVAVVRGLSQFVMDTTAPRIFGDVSNWRHIKEAVTRRNSLPSSTVNMISRLFGIDMSPELASMGSDFVEEITKRQGPGVVSRLLKSVESLPTPAEVGAPGLWLARVGLEY